jgi:peptidoglycan hydrolase CwlO-like protein
MRRSILLVFVQVTIAASMFGVCMGQTINDSELAVHEQRMNAIDNHIDNTDGNVDKLYLRVESIEKDLSEMRGEERGAWGFITILGMLNIGLQFTRRKVT